LCCSTSRALDRCQSGTWDTEPKPFVPFVISLRQYAVIFVVVIYLKKYTDGKVDSEYLFSNKQPQQQTTSSIVFLPMHKGTIRTIKDFTATL